MKLKAPLFIITILLTSCINNTSNKTKPAINVSIAPQQYFANQLLGDGYQVNVVVQPGAPHESYEPTARQMQDLEKASIYLMLCENGFDQPWAKALKDHSPLMNVVDCSGGIDLITEDEAHCHESTHHHTSIDPHIWISPSTTLVMVNNMKEALMKQFPADSATITKNYKNIAIEINELDNSYKTALAPFAGKKFMIYHPILSYMARDYGLTQLSIENEGKEPSVAQIKELIDTAKANNIKIIFIQKEFDTANAKLIATETGARVVPINPNGYDWPYETSLILSHLTKAFQEQ